MTLKEYSQAIEQLLIDNPEYGNFPIIYASDDEGNSYHKVHSLPEPIEIEDLGKYELELVWDDSGTKLGINYNAIIIN